MIYTMRNFAALFSFLAVLFAPSSFGQASITEWKPNFRFDGELFPSFILANATRTLSTPDRPNVFGDRLGSLGISIKSPRDGAKARAIITVDGLASDGSIEQILPNKDNTYLLIPKVRYDFAALLRLVQPTTTSVHYQVFLDNEKVVDEVQTIRVRSINDTPLATYRDGRVASDYSYMVAAYVNENNPVLEQVLRGALQLPQPIVRSFGGYQSPVLPQVFAIWYFLQRSGFAYTTITTPSAMAEGVVSQHVRFVDDSVRVRQSNCIDGTVLFASVLRKIGIDPVIVLIPGHAFLGFYTDARHQQIAFLETTLMTATNPFTNRAPSQIGTAIARVLHSDPQMARSASGFDHALEIGRQSYEKGRAGISSRAQYYAMIDIDKMRRAGVQPIGR